MFRLVAGFLTMVALRKESVDRNIARGQLPTPEPPVALRKESVDRNCRYPACCVVLLSVALRKESVDRNLSAMQIVIIVVGRSPQGERG